MGWVKAPTLEPGGFALYRGAKRLWFTGLRRLARRSAEREGGFFPLRAAGQASCPLPSAGQASRPSVKFLTVP